MHGRLPAPSTLSRLHEFAWRTSGHPKPFPNPNPGAVRSEGLQDLRAVPVQAHRRGAERAADLAHGGRALDPVVAVSVVSADAARNLRQVCPDRLGAGSGVGPQWNGHWR
jgi:hypothetical protein